MRLLRALFIVILGISPVLSQDPAAPSVEPSTLPGMEARPEEKEAMPAPRAAETPAPAAKKEIPPAVTGPSYVVRQGDTLWDLAGTFYKDPFAWKRIWDANRTEIPNPDLIYPHQRFAVPGVTSAAASRMVEPEPETEMEEAAGEPMETAAAEPEEVSADEEDEAAEPAPSAKKQKLYAYQAGSYVAPADWSGDGQIMGDRAKKIMIAQQDVVYLNIGASNGVRPRMRADIYRKGRKVRDPSTGYKAGIVVRRVGVLEISTEVGDETSSAVVITSYEPLQVGDVVALRD
jgi:LysM repeat protein